MSTPRYVDYNEVVSWLVNKVTFDLVDSLPQPTTVTANTDTTVTLGWSARPANYNLLSPIANGSGVTQGTPTVTAFGTYLGTVDLPAFGIIVGNVQGTFTTSGGPLALSGNPNAITLPLLESLIAKAEAQVENDFYPLYDIPFVGTDGSDYVDLPETTLEYLNNMFVLKSCIKILRIGFGKSNGVRGEEYIKALDAEYTEQKNIVFTRARTGNMLSIPLPNLKINAQNINWNRLPMPMVNNDNYSSVKFAKSHINNPAISPFLGGPFTRRGNGENGGGC